MKTPVSKNCWLKFTDKMSVNELTWEHERYTHLSFVQWWILSVFRKEEHVYEVDEYAGSKLRLGRGVGDPFEDHHKHQVAKETQHEDQLRNQHAKYTAELAKVARKTHEKGRLEGKVRIHI